MPVAESLPDLESVVRSIGRAGRRLAELGACEGAAGNISVAVRGALDPGSLFANTETITLPVAVPELAGTTFVATGSGCRLRDLLDEPQANLGCLVVDGDGVTGTLFSSPQRRFARLTSELNSHVAVHYRQLLASGRTYHALIHAHAPHLTFLSHLADYQDQAFLNRRLMRWEPEAIIFLSEGIGVAPFNVPGSPELMAATVGLLDRHQVVIWGKHGVIAHSFDPVEEALDRIEYAEAAARYEYMDLVTGSRATGMSDDEIRAVCAFHQVEQSIV
jgi:rhamnulose-1-phosphate aldolase